MISDEKKRTGGLLSGQKLFGCKVENLRGESLGRIEDLMISPENGQIAYAVVSFGGVLSLGNKLFAFPWSALQVDGPRKKVLLNLDKKTLAKSRGFDKDHWPDSSDWNWGDADPSQVPSTLAATPAVLAETSRKDAPSLGEIPSMEPAAPSKNRMEQWGKSWQSHGLDRT